MKLAWIVRLMVAAIAVSSLAPAATAGAGGGESGEKFPPGLAKEVPRPLEEPQADQTFVASVAGSAAYVAIVVDGKDVGVYVCDGAELGEWFGGSLGEGEFDVTSKGGVRVTGQVADDQVVGELTLPDGAPLPFTAVPAVEGSTGLYRETFKAEDGKLLLGWIITDAGIRGITDGAKDTTIAIATDVPAEPAPPPPPPGTTATTVVVGSADQPVQTRECNSLLARVNALGAQISALQEEGAFSNRKKIKQLSQEQDNLVSQERSMNCAILSGG